MTFPPEAPGSLSDRDAIVAGDWDAFRTLDRLHNHWNRPAWPDGAEAIYWLLAFGDEPELATRATECQSHLAPLGGLDPVPVDLLHLTLHRVADTATPEQLADIAEQTTRAVADFAPFRLMIGPLAGSPGAARFSVSPWTELFRLHRALAELTPADLPERPIRQLRPHVSIAYNAIDRPATPLIEATRPLRSVPAVEVAVSTALLVKLRRVDRTYRWQVINTARLGAGNS